MALWLTVLAIGFAWSGCEPWDPWANDDGDAVVLAPYGSISVYQLAGRLRMTVTEADQRTASLRNGGPETVLISAGFTDRVYVNGQELNVSGEIIAVDGVLFVSESFERPIREALRAAGAYSDRPISTTTTTTTTVPTGHQRRPVVIDPGHGGYQTGSKGAVGVEEKHVNLAIALKVVDLLRARGVPVVLTRATDVFVDLNDRPDLGNRLRASLFVSIHANGHETPEPHGYEVYIAEKADDRSQAAAEIIERHFAGLGSVSRGVKRNDLRVLVRSTGPAVLVETGFLTNPTEGRKLISESYQDRLARALADAIVEALAGLDS